MATQQEVDRAAAELAVKTAQAEEKKVAFEWMKNHLNDYDQTQENGAIIGDYLKKYNMPFTYLNLEQAFLICKAQGHRFKKGMPSPGQQSEDGLPPVPAYMLAVSPLKTRKDIDAMSPADYKKFYNGPDSFAFKARVEFVSNKRG